MSKPRRKHTDTPIGRYRAEKGILQSDLAERLCISQALLSQIERGERQPSRPVMALFRHLATSEGWAHDEFSAVGV